jgi:sec-independent protein translocase protein TatA
MLGLDNPLHIAFILVLLLLVFGAKRLPEMGKSLGHGLRGFKESISGEDSTAHLTEALAPVRVDEQPQAVADPVVAEPVVAEPVVVKPVAERIPLHPAA